MSINNINGPVGPDRPAKSREAVPSKTDRATGTGPTKGAKPVKTTQDVTASEQAARDTVQILRDTRQVEELTAKVEQMGDTPREDAVTRATERVRSGYYSKPEFMEQLALTLINVEPAGN